MFDKTRKGIFKFKEWCEETFDDDVVFDWIKRIYRDIKTGIGNLIKWFPTIWSDRQWDHTFLFCIMKKKLELMSYFFKNRAYAVDADKEAEKIDFCIHLLARLIKDDYAESLYTKMYEKWGEPEFKFEPWKDNEEFHKLLIEHENVKTEEDQNQLNKEFKICGEHEENMRIQDLYMLFRTMEKNVRCWWD